MVSKVRVYLTNEVVSRMHTLIGKLSRQPHIALIKWYDHC
jgi:hypothetical protein